MPDNNFLNFRNIEKRDEAEILKLRNNPSSLEFFKDPNPISKENHARWFDSRLSAYEELQIVGTFGDQPIGIVFLDPQDDCICSISININPHFQSQGIGRELLMRMLSRATSLHFSRVEATIHISNIKSISLFESCGFRYVERVSKIFSRYVRLID